MRARSSGHVYRAATQQKPGSISVEPGGEENSVSGGLKENVFKPDPTLKDRTLLKYVCGSVINILCASCWVRGNTGKPWRRPGLFQPGRPGAAPQESDAPVVCLVPVKKRLVFLFLA